jgi:hypothetical protein
MAQLGLKRRNLRTKSFWINRFNILGHFPVSGHARVKTS